MPGVSARKRISTTEPSRDRGLSPTARLMDTASVVPLSSTLTKGSPLDLNRNRSPGVMSTKSICVSSKVSLKDAPKRGAMSLAKTLTEKTSPTSSSGLGDSSSRVGAAKLGVCRTASRTSVDRIEAMPLRVPGA